MNTNTPYVPETLLITVAGCPNACRHCFLHGGLGSERDEQFVRTVHDRFAAYARSQGRSVPAIYLYMLEPFFHSRWQTMHELADVLNRSSGHSSIKQMAFDSIPTVGWRMVHTDGFAGWLRSNGYKRLQLTLFGLRDTHDWFAGRKGAFDDLLAAARNALDMDLTVHTSIMLHNRMIEELPELLRFLGERGLPQFEGWSRESFQTLDPVGRAYAMEHLRPDMHEIEALPAEVTARIWGPWRDQAEWERPESYLVDKAVGDEDTVPGYNSRLGLTVAMDGNVYPDHCNMEDGWHCLGNVLHENVPLITERFRSAEPPGLRVRATVSRAQLARHFGDSDGRKAYAGLKQLTERWIRQWCEKRLPGLSTENAGKALQDACR